MQQYLYLIIFSIYCLFLVPCHTFPIQEWDITLQKIGNGHIRGINHKIQNLTKCLDLADGWTVIDYNSRHYATFAHIYLRLNRQTGTAIVRGRAFAEQDETSTKVISKMAVPYKFSSSNFEHLLRFSIPFKHFQI